MQQPLNRVINYLCLIYNNLCHRGSSSQLSAISSVQKHTCHPDTKWGICIKSQVVIEPWPTRSSATTIVHGDGDTSMRWKRKTKTPSLKTKGSEYQPVVKTCHWYTARWNSAKIHGTKSEGSTWKVTTINQILHFVQYDNKHWTGYFTSFNMTGWVQCERVEKKPP